MTQRCLTVPLVGIRSCCLRHDFVLGYLLGWGISNQTTHRRQSACPSLPTAQLRRRCVAIFDVGEAHRSGVYHKD